MTKTSDRYAKWFGTRVPTVSRSFTVLFALIEAIPFSAILYLIFGITIFTTNLLIVLAFTLPVGCLLHIVYLLLLQARFSNLSNNPEFQNILSRIHQRIIVSPMTHVWVRPSSELFITSTFNPVFNAVIVSEPMLDLIIKSPDSGEALLAFHLLRAPETRWFADLLGSVILFLLFTYASSLFLNLSGGFYLFYYLVSLSGSLLVGFALFIILVKGTFWKHEPAFDGIQEIYGIHPNVAKIQVERGITLNEEEAQTVVWSVREWEKNKRGARRTGICTIITILSYFLGYLLMLWIAYPYFPYFLLNYLPFAVAGGAALISYFLIKRWDKNAMSEVFRKTTDYDEPIWID